MTQRRRLAFALVVALVLCSSPCPARAQQVPLEALVLDGDGAGDEQTFLSFIGGAPINDAGQILVQSRLGDSSAALFRFEGPAGQARQVARFGSPVPLFDQGVIYSSHGVGNHVVTQQTFAGVQFFQDGAVKFDVNVCDDPQQDLGLIDEDINSGDSFLTILGQPDQLQLIARQAVNGFAAGSGMRLSDGLGRNAAGDLVFLQGIGLSKRKMMYQPTDHQAVELTRRYGYVQGTTSPQGEAYRITGGANALDTRPMINNAGQVLFSTQINSSGNGVWLGGPEGFQTILADVNDAPVPGSDNPDVRVWSVASATARMNASGLIAVAGRTEDTSKAVCAGCSGEIHAKLWMGTAQSGLSAVLEEGLPVPGIQEPGVTLGGDIVTPVLDDSDRFAATVSLRGAPEGQNVALMLGEVDGLWRRVLTRGQAIPGSQEEYFNPYSITSLAISINRAGQMLITSPLSGGEHAFGDDVLVFYDPQTDSLTTLAKSGQAFELSPGDVRVIDDILISAGSTSTTLGQLGSLNNDGLFTCVLTFTDGTSGVFVGDSAVLPEPASLAMLTAGWVVVASSRRRPWRSA